MDREENPFENPEIAELWTASVEGERQGARELHIYPALRAWLRGNHADRVLDIGCGQGIASTIVEGMEYVGVEPSAALVERARAQYSDIGTFYLGNVYALPFPDAAFRAAFSINVWFHLKDINQASQELSRVLQPGGSALIVTANPHAYDTWKTFYSDVEEHEGMFSGKARIPLVTLPRNDFYQHTHEAIVHAFETAHLAVRGTQSIAPYPRNNVMLFRYYDVVKTSP